MWVLALEMYCRLGLREIQFRTLGSEGYFLSDYKRCKKYYILIHILFSISANKRLAGGHTS